jgi:hypothetical protein
MLCAHALELVWLSTTFELAELKPGVPLLGLDVAQRNLEVIRAWGRINHDSRGGGDQ